MLLPDHGSKRTSPGWREQANADGRLAEVANRVRPLPPPTEMLAAFQPQELVMLAYSLAKQVGTAVHN